MTPILLAASDGGGFTPPSLKDFFPQAILFEGTFFEFNRIHLLRVVAAAVLLLIFVLAARRATLVPGRFQNVIELILGFIRKNIVEDIMGAERARRYVPMITTIFLSILAFNLTGVIPFLNLAGTSVAGVAIVLALWVFVAYWAAGIRAHGLGGYLRANLFPPGIPKPIYVILAPIELLQLLIIRPASLIIRLTANMVAGHIMLVLCFLATHYLVLEASPALKPIAALTFVGAIGVTLFEVFVALLQAYIFALLATVYINMSLEEEH